MNIGRQDHLLSQADTLANKTQIHIHDQKVTKTIFGQSSFIIMIVKQIPQLLFVVPRCSLLTFLPFIKPNL